MCIWRILPALAVLLAFTPSPSVAQKSAPGKVTIRVEKDGIDFLVGKELVTRYVTALTSSKPHFWPLNAPHGEAITRPWPMVADVKGEAKDHPHHRSAWFCHGDVVPEGMELKVRRKGIEGVDFWSEGAGHGKIICVKVGPVVQVSDHHASVTTWNEWRTSDGVKIMDEARTIHLLDLGMHGRLIVLDIDLHASVAPITFADTKEGSLGIRVRESMRADKGKGQMVNAEGKSGEGAKSNAARNGCWGLRSAWVDYSGPVGERTAGIAVMAHPRNPIASAWHARNYGLLAANPFGRHRSGFPDLRDNKELVRIARDGHLKLRYGLLVHAGNAADARVAAAYERFAALPR